MMTDFTNIPNGLFRNMPKLASLIMPGNKLKVIKSNDFEGLVNMHSIDLSENYINTIQNGAFSPMTRLDTLDLRSQYDLSVTNPLNFTLDAIKGAELALKTLHIQENLLVGQFAWEAIGAMKNLANLDISKTGLSHIPSLVFYSHDKLGSLRMSDNNLTVLRQESVYGLQYSLEVIDITKNKIHTIDECVFKGFNKLTYFFATDNSFVCDCNLHGLYLILKAFPLTGLATLTCTNLPNTPSLLNLQPSAFCPNLPTPATCPVLTTTTTAPTTTIGTTTVVPLPDIQFGISSETTNTIVISWTVSGDMTYLKNFLVQYKQLGINNPQEKSFPLDKSKRDHPITGLNPGSRYEICFFMELTQSSKQILISCPTGTTKPGSVTDIVTTAANTGSNDNTAEIVGGVLGGVLFIALIVVLIFVFIICRKKEDKKPPLPPPNGNITPIDYRPQMRPTSHPKVYVRKANGEMEVMTISNGNLDTSRISGGSYQNIDRNVSNDPYPTKGATGGGEAERDPKQLHVKLPPEHKPENKTLDKDRYTRMPTGPNYVNEVHRMAQPDHYTNAVETRPLPQTPNSHSMSSEGGGFLNHGFTSSPTEKVYHEIQDTVGTVV